MKLIYASEYRAAARSMLRGRWTEAVIVGLVAALLSGGFQGNSPLVTLNFTDSGVSFGNAFSQQNVFAGSGSYMLSAIGAMLAVVLTILAVAALLLAIVLGGVIETGYARYNMKLVNGAPAGFGDLFSDFKRWGTCFVMQILRTLITFIGSLLFVIPGVIAAYGLQMAPYILAEHPDYTAWQAISESWDMMRGHKMRLFCLEISFIGWTLLCAFTCGIGILWLNPYEHASRSIFYLELAGDYYARTA